MKETDSMILAKVDKCLARFKTNADQERLKQTRASLKMKMIIREEYKFNNVIKDLVRECREKIREYREILANDRDMPEKERHEMFGSIDTYQDIVRKYDVAVIDAEITEISRSLDVYVEKVS